MVTRGGVPVMADSGAGEAPPQQSPSQSMDLQHSRRRGGPERLRLQRRLCLVASRVGDAAPAAVRTSAGVARSAPCAASTSSDAVLLRSG